MNRVLCCNVVSDASKSSPELFRHPIYSYEEELAWPPVGWEAWCCWHCCQRLEHAPVPLPHDRDATTGSYHVYGIFCSFSCGKKYLLERVPWSAGERMMLLEQMARECFGHQGRIAPAPAQHRLRMFGGDLDLDEFRAESSGPYTTMALSPPLLTFPEIYERFTTSGSVHDQWSVRNIRPRRAREQEETPAKEQAPQELEKQPSLFSEHLRKCGGSDEAWEKAKETTTAPLVATPGTLSVFIKKKTTTHGQPSKK